MNHLPTHSVDLPFLSRAQNEEAAVPMGAVEPVQDVPHVMADIPPLAEIGDIFHTGETTETDDRPYGPGDESEEEDEA